MQYSKAIILQFKIKKLKKAIVKLLVFYYFLKRHCWMSLSYDRRFHWSCILDYSSFYKENKPKDQNLMSIDSCCLVAESCSTLLRPDGLEPTRLFCPWDFPDKNTGVGFHLVLQGIFLTQGLNLHLLHWQVDSLPLTPSGNPMNL